MLRGRGVGASCSRARYCLVVVHCESSALSGNVCYEVGQWEHLAPVPDILFSALLN
ncbi:MAG: hypothetical protein F6K40_28185 [Okeania sp. SIO3I5]|uniref:hypothetical protein n=1 Tax=Okeania sp. SIO3I5 TaxID=2607805 RepID=UPI0013B97D38|nr:hypothetical protein [Okeania sp. SIO3I5]NEQ39913.1 hypothetical protein [Okeania sp. SIO3I5]